MRLVKIDPDVAKAVLNGTKKFNASKHEKKKEQSFPSLPILVLKQF